MSAPLRVGVIGANLAGSWGSLAHLPALAALEGLRATAVATTHMASAQATAAHFGLHHAFDDPRRLVDHPDVDIVAVCARVPTHRELVTMAVEAGKHVYCEWPLGRDTEEAEELLELANRRGVVHMAGLQARSSPELNYLVELIRDGALGTVRTVALDHAAPWRSRPPRSSSYCQVRASGAHFLSIPGGHSLDALCWLLGEFEQVSAIVRTAIPDIAIAETGEPFTRTSADLILVQGVLESGPTATLRLIGTSPHGSGIRLEISGDAGEFVVTGAPGAHGIQMTDLSLFRSEGNAKLTRVEMPERMYRVPPAARRAPVLNVASAYVELAEAIASRQSPVPDFSDAVRRHRSLDRIERAAGLTA